MKELKFGIDNQFLADWVQNNSRNFIGRVFETSSSIRLLLDGANAQVNNKPGQGTMLFVDVDVNLQESGCARGTGTTPMFDKPLVTHGLMDNEFYCSKDLYKTYASWALRNGMSPDGEFSTQFIDYLVDQKLLALNKANEKLVWLGNTISIDGNLNKMDGYIKLIRAASGVISLDSVETDIVTKLQENLSKMPIEVIESADFRIFIGTDEALLYNIAVANKNLFSEATQNILFGTNAIVVPTPGLSGTGIQVMARLSDLAISTDLASDLDTVDVNYSVEKRGIYLDIDYALGVQIGRPEYIGISPAGAVPAITAQPTNDTVADGGTAEFTVVATGATSYNWELSTDGGTVYAPVVGATSATYSFTAASADTGNKYRVVVSNANGSVTSSVVTLTVT